MEATMIARVATSVIVVLALSAGAAFAASRLASSDAGTEVCVNSTNGLMRVASTCREGESPLTIGGGGDVRVTQNGTFSVPWGETGGGKALPLTGVSVSGRCEVAPPEFGEITLARFLIEAASGQTMDVFTSGSTNPVGRSSLLTPPLSSVGGGFPAQSGTRDAIVTSNGATAVLNLGGYVDVGARTCTYLSQAVETPN
jgi:hypothetical protein